MPTVLASAILSKAKTILQDTTNVRWADSELLGWLNDGQREICMRRPDASVKLQSIALVAGTKQSIPDEGTAVIRVIRNMGANGTTPGRAIRHVPMDILDSNIPTWHTTAQSAEILHAVVDARMPQTFYVYPPATNGTQVEVLFSAPPADVAAVGNAITVDDVFQGPLIDYICFRAYNKDQDLTGNTDRAQAHRVLFEASLNAKTAADAGTAASTNVKG